MKKKFLSLMLASTMLSSVLYQTASAVTMYAPDGRTAAVMECDVPSWKSVGWYDVPVTTVYALDGRTAVIATSDVPAWKAVGWYDVNYIRMYAPDGRVENVLFSDIAAWKAVGWYDYPVKTMYAPDGRSAIISTDDVQAWKAVGWYDIKFIRMYAPDGRISDVLLPDIAAWKADGWYDYPVAHTPDFNPGIYFWGQDLETVFTPDNSIMIWGKNFLGLDWYRLTNKSSIGFKDVNVIDDEHKYDNGGKMVAISLPIWEAYPDLYETGGLDRTLTLAEFENYLHQDVKFISSYDNVYNSPYLSYSHNNYDVIVTCDECGNVKVSHYERSGCIIIMK